MTGAAARKGCGPFHLVRTLGRVKRKSRLGAFVHVRPIKGCNFVAYHATYAGRVAGIKERGLRPGPKNDIWLTTDPKFASAHAASRAAQEGCPDAPLSLLRVRVTASGACPIYRPIGKGRSKLFMTHTPIPASNILQTMPVDKDGVAEGRARGLNRAKKRKRVTPTQCPPPVTLHGGRRR